MKKFISFILCIILLISSSLILTSCNKKVSETEAIMIVEDLVKASYELNEIYYGKGLDYEKSIDGEYDSIYSHVSLDEIYVTQEILSIRTREVFSASYANSIIDYAFNMSLGGVGGSGSYQRYITGSDGFLTVYRDYKVMDITEYDYTSIKIEKIKRRKITATVMSTENEAVEVVIVKESSGWRLDSATV